MTNLKIFAVVVGTILLYAALANAIPQVQSAVPQELVLAGDVTPEQLVAAGEDLFNGAGGCTACHGLGARAPNLIGDEAGTGPIGVRCAERVPATDCRSYLWESMTDPSAYVVEGYDPIMPDARRTLSEPQIWTLVAFLQNQGGTVSVTAEDVAVEEEAAAGGAAGGGGAPALAGGSTDPEELLQAATCLVCHQLGDQGAAIGPPFDGMGARLDADAIRRGILLPNADTAAGFAAMAGTMPATFGEQLNATQLESIVQYLAGLR
ncbi:MAG: c-type cytochrome [Gemmatimonadota bacterium]